MGTLRQWRKGDPLTAQRLQEMQACLAETLRGGRGIRLSRAGQRLVISADGVAGGGAATGGKQRMLYVFGFADGVLLCGPSATAPATYTPVWPAVTFWQSLWDNDVVGPVVYTSASTGAVVQTLTYVYAGDFQTRQVYEGAELLGTERITPPYCIGQMITVASVRGVGLMDATPGRGWAL